MNKQDSVDLLHPSMLQIQYLMELEKVGKCYNDRRHLWGESWTGQSFL